MVQNVPSPVNAPAHVAPTPDVPIVVPRPVVRSSLTMVKPSLPVAYMDVGACAPAVPETTATIRNEMNARESFMRASVDSLNELALALQLSGPDKHLAS